MNRDSFHQLQRPNTNSSKMQPLQHKNISLSELSVVLSDYSDQTTTTQSTNTNPNINSIVAQQLANTRRVSSRIDTKLCSGYNFEKVANSRDCSRCCTIQPIQQESVASDGLILSFGDSSACLVNLNKLPIVTIQPKLLGSMLGNYKLDLIMANDIYQTNDKVSLGSQKYKCSFHIPTRYTEFKRSLKDKFISKIKIQNQSTTFKYNWIYNENVDCWLLQTPLHPNLVLAKFFTEKFKVNNRLEFYIKLDLPVQWILLTVIGFIVYN